MRGVVRRRFYRSVFLNEVQEACANGDKIAPLFGGALFLVRFFGQAKK